MFPLYMPHIPVGMTEDFSNGMILAFIEGLSNRVQEEGESLVADLEDDEEMPIDIPVNQHGIRVFLVHSMGLSYIEACSVLLLEDAMRREVEPECTQLLEYTRNDCQYSRVVDDRDTREAELQALIEYLDKDRTSMADYQRLLDGSGIMDDGLIERIDNLRDTRGRFIHNLLTLIRFRTGEEIKEMVTECVDVVNEVEKTCRDTIVLHEIYHHFTDYQHK